MLRLAEERDLNDCIRMAKSFHSLSPFSAIEFSEEKSKELFFNYLSNPRDLIIILACDDKPFGMIIGMRSELLFSETSICTEIAWWVDEDKRGSRDSLLLLQAYEDWSKRVGSKFTTMAMLDDSKDLSRLYERLGYQQCERTFFKET